MLPCIFNLGTGEIIVILIAFLLLFGAKRIPELARSLGKGISSFMPGINDTVSQINNTDIQNDTPADKDRK